MAERPVSLDLHTNAGQFSFDARDARHDQRPAADSDAAMRFQRELGRDLGATAPRPLADEQALPAGPFALFGAAAASPAALAAPGLFEALHGMVDRLLVGDGSGPRGVCIDLADEVLPGVSVSIQQDAGAWVAEFTCRDEQSFESLARPAHEMARKLAAELNQDAVWRVIADGAPADRTVEAFASSVIGRSC